VKPVEDMDGIPKAFSDDCDIRFPHIRADKLDILASFCTHKVAKGIKRFLFMVFANPQ
jgi:hypothetical protein